MASGCLRKAGRSTLIELMIVVAIIAILASIGLPLYQSYRVKAGETACLAEMKNYASLSLSLLQNKDTPSAAPKRACAYADNATVIGADITGRPSMTGARTSICDMESANCWLQ